jgi:hypothetical protein
MQAQVNITDRLHKASGARLHRVHLGQGEPLHVVRPGRPQFHQSPNVGSSPAVLSFVFSVQVSKVIRQILVTRLRLFHRLTFAYRHLSWKFGGVTSNLRANVFSGRDSVMALLDTGHKFSQWHRYVLKAFNKFADAQRTVKPLAFIMIRCKPCVNSVFRRFWRLWYHSQQLQSGVGRLKRVEALYHVAGLADFDVSPVFGLDEVNPSGTIKGHLLATSFGLSAWVRNVSALRTLQLYTLEADA